VRGLVAGLERLGASVAVVPLVEVVRSPSNPQLAAALRGLDRYEWIVFTSVNGVVAVRDQLRGGSLDGVSIAAVGPATAAAVRDLGVEPSFVPERYEAAEIAKGVGTVGPGRVLLPQGDLASPRLASELRRRGAVVDAVVAYRTVAREPSVEEIVELEEPADAIVLASGSAADVLARLARRVPGVRAALLVCIGPRTADAADSAGLRVGLVAEEASVDGIIQALTTHFGERT
jgi:uroporphyrinogen III methyltransferase/synthase